MISFDEIKKKAVEVGFDDVGITEASISKKEISNYQEWLKKKWHGNLTYMENQLRCYPEQLLPGAKTAIIFISYYKKEKREFKNDKGLIASYARGKDYHLIHRKRLKKFIAWLKERAGKPQQGDQEIAKGFSDSTPVLEKALAVQAGLGWLGKNSLLIHKRFGTFTLLAGLFTTLEIEKSPLHLSLPKCGSCQRCMDACPTGALTNPYQINATLCLSYHLIESKEDIPENIQKKNPGYIFGCDICQDICPHNVRKESTKSLDFSENEQFFTYLDKGVIEKLEMKPEMLFGTPLQRRKIAGLKKNGLSLSLFSDKVT